MTEETKPYLNKPVIFFDGICNLCEQSVQYVLRNDPKELFLFSTLQSDLANTILEDTGHSLLKTVILYQDKKVYFKSSAALRIARQLKGVNKILWCFIIVPKPFRDFFYDIISRNRYRWFGKKDECLIPDEKLLARFV